ncbi:unnamed protein product [Didymodactylos carnosus]|uniref:Uncharacterized protein n=1 Tax=Didymodactylos carnosus TaxID=1234261 RepID=A0A814QIU0_9BILA|nr:unnamed protein product [Didymodactylos carnosus]CAF1120295.1 unnamed protein product [Didymodactylos carnosus]CAF3578548.1 unnamed protein product [Didymodactylos carnosus]CAF3883931.1 unnamed protein product [Didymodactylos carnosus]
MWTGNKQGGIYICDNGDIYEGEWTDEGIVNGFGRAEYEDGRIYSGMWKNGSRHGEGTMSYLNGKQLTGNWYEGRLYLHSIDIAKLIHEISNITKTTTSCFTDLKTFFRQKLLCSTSKPERLKVTLKTLLSYTPSEYLNYFINDLLVCETDKWNPLIVSARNGYSDLVKMLLNEFNIDLEKEGTVQVEAYAIKGATALWCAAAWGHLDIIQMLIDRGANVNHYTKTRSTPLRAACFSRRLDIVKYLIDHGADVNIVNSRNHSCLMLASYKGYEELVDYLCKIGCILDATNDEGSTALHAAVEEDHLSIVQCLVSNGAGIIRNSENSTPPTIAALNRRNSIVEYFSNNTKLCSKEERIETLELLASSYVNDVDERTQISFEYMVRAMQMRYLDLSNPTLKIVLPAVEAYENHVECETLDELESIRCNANALYMEALAIRERILGTNSSALLQSIMYRGAVYAEKANYCRCVALWMRVLELKIFHAKPVDENLLKFAEVFIEMARSNIDINTKDLIKILKCVIVQLQHKRTVMYHCTKNEEQKLEEHIFDDNCYTMLFLIVVISKISFIDDFIGVIVKTSKRTSDYLPGDQLFKSIELQNKPQLFHAATFMSQRDNFREE